MFLSVVGFSSVATVERVREIRSVLLSRLLGLEIVGDGVWAWFGKSPWFAPGRGFGASATAVARTPVTFETDSAAISPEGTMVVSRVAQSLKQCPCGSAPHRIRCLRVHPSARRMESAHYLPCAHTQSAQNQQPDLGPAQDTAGCSKARRPSFPELFGSPHLTKAPPMRPANSLGQAVVSPSCVGPCVRYCLLDGRLLSVVQRQSRFQELTRRCDSRR